MAEQEIQQLKDEERIVRIMSKDIEGKMKIYPGLTKIKGISWAMSNAVCKLLGFEREKIVGSLRENDIKKIIEFLTKNKMINYVCTCSGLWDIMCECYAKNPVELRALINEIMSKFSNNIKKLDTTIMLNEYVSLNKSILKGQRVGELEHKRIILKISPRMSNCQPKKLIGRFFLIFCRALKLFLLKRK